MSEETPKKKGWFGRLTEGLVKSSQKLTTGITEIFTKKKLDQETLDELEELLIAADLGPVTAARLVEEFGRGRFGKEIAPDEVKAALADGIAATLAPAAGRLEPDPARNPFVVLVVGVNGAGKTTTIGKLAQGWSRQGLRPMMAAGDTFRAAAVAQLRIWSERASVPLVSRPEGADPAALAFEAIAEARAAGRDVLLVDTAGRLQNKSNLMQELQKIVRVMRKQDPTAPHATLLVLDATTGQNAIVQVEIFKEMVDVTGLVLTKLDGSARGGVLVALAERFRLPVVAVGVGEGIEDLRPFDPQEFARALVGLGQ